MGHAKDVSDVLEMAHIAHGIGMGGRKSADTLDAVGMLCRLHHDLLDGRNMTGKRVEIAGLLTNIIRSSRRIWPTDPAIPVD